MKNRLLWPLVSVVLILMASSCAVNPVTGKKELNFMSEDKEIALGAQYDPVVVAQYGIYQDEKIQAFIDEKGQEMARVSHRPHLNYSFKIMDSPVVNAFAVPGGYVYFTRGIMAHFNNEAEFAGVLGHEIGHITARHAAQQQTQQMLGSGIFVAGAILSPQIRDNAEMAQQQLGLMFLKFGRDDESQSDTLGVAYSTAVGYDASYMAGFFKTLNRLSGGPENRIPEFASTHPDPLNRYEEVKRFSRKYQERSSLDEFKVNRNSYLQMIDGLVYGEDPRQGFVEGNRFYHPQLLFVFDKPADWRLMNSPTMVQMAPEDGKSVINFTLADGESMEAAAQAFQEQYKTTTVSQRSLKINGMNALEVISTLAQQDQSTGQTSELTIHSTYIEYGEMIYIFMGLSSSADYASRKSSFVNTAQSFDKLTDPKYINIKPERIKIAEVPQSMTLRQALDQNNIPTERHEELAILNGMQLGDTLDKGMLFKVVSR